MLPLPLPLLLLLLPPLLRPPLVRLLPLLLLLLLLLRGGRVVVFAWASAFLVPAHEKLVVVYGPICTHYVFTPSKAFMQREIRTDGTLYTEEV